MLVLEGIVERLGIVDLHTPLDACLASFALWDANHVERLMVFTSVLMHSSHVSGCAQIDRFFLRSCGDHRLSMKLSSDAIRSEIEHTPPGSI